MHLHHKSSRSTVTKSSEYETRYENVDIVITYAIRDTGLKYSIRSIDKDVSAADLVRHLVDGHGVGGGHKTMAGGFIPAENFPGDRSYGTFSRVRAIEFIESDGVNGRR